MFDFPEVGPLSPPSARIAIEKPVIDRAAQIASDAIEAIIAETRGYPFFLQEWGKHVWNTAAHSPITVDDVTRATPLAKAALDESFFHVRFDRLTAAERRYLRAMAELGPGPHRSGAIAEMMKRKVTSIGSMRDGLISKGMVWSPSHGDTAFSVPLFDEYIRRAMPDDEWRH